MILAAVHETLGIVACRYAGKLNDFSARTIRTIRYNEIHVRGIIDENEAVCRDQGVEPITGIGAGINSGSKSRGAKESEGDDKDGPLHTDHSRKPKPASAATISISHSFSMVWRAYRSPNTASFQIPHALS